MVVINNPKKHHHWDIPKKYKHVCPTKHYPVIAFCELNPVFLWVWFLGMGVYVPLTTSKKRGWTKTELLSETHQRRTFITKPAETRLGGWAIHLKTQAQVKSNHYPKDYPEKRNLQTHNLFSHHLKSLEDNDYNPQSLTARLWNMMVGRWSFSFWHGIYFQGLTVKLQVGKNHPSGDTN